MNEIEIGMTVVGKLYLHCAGVDIPTAFDISKIERVLETELGGAIVMYEDRDRRSVTEENRSYVNPYIVEEKKEDIEKAIEEAMTYRDAALTAINSMLNK